jgi:phosphoribosylglycinamide formyltransferase 1
VGRRVVVLASGTGTNLDALLEADFAGSVVAVVTDRHDAGALTRARDAGIPASTVGFREFTDRDSWAGALSERIASSDPDLVVLAGFMRILPAQVVSRWPMLNVHPSLLPAFPGSRAVESALEWGVKVTGSTVHFVDEQVDHGPIVLQEAVEVREDDDAGSLHRRIKTVEHRLLPEAVALFCAGRLRVDGRYVRILP